MNQQILFDSKYLTFWKVEEKPKTNVYAVLAKDGNVYLGTIKWYPNWRQYSFFAEGGMVFEKTCLTDITNFIKMLMEERKNVKQR